MKKFTSCLIGVVIGLTALLSSTLQWWGDDWYKVLISTIFGIIMGMLLADFKESVNIFSKIWGKTKIKTWGDNLLYHISGGIFFILFMFISAVIVVILLYFTLGVSEEIMIVKINTIETFVLISCAVYFISRLFYFLAHDNLYYDNKIKKYSWNEVEFQGAYFILGNRKKLEIIKSNFIFNFKISLHIFSVIIKTILNIISLPLWFFQELHKKKHLLAVSASIVFGGMMGTYVWHSFVPGLYSGLLFFFGSWIIEFAIRHIVKKELDFLWAFKI